ncbi:MAG: tRNA (adenosine(37)-N6)-dimethylallyltransferase MiaA [Anaerolineales bacterium]
MNHLKIHNKPLIVIVGPTAVGKSEIAIQLAERLQGEIVSADSRLLYRGMDIGTDKPKLDQLTRLPHYLIDVADPDEVWSLAIYQSEAYKAINKIHDKEKLPFLVGGTGQYVRAVVEGWRIPKVKPDVRLRHALEKWAAEITPVGLYKRLTSIDPDAAARIDPANLRRTIRALEIIFHTGERYSEQRRRTSPPFKILQIGLIRSRSKLYTRIDRRIEMMIENGLIEEVRGLLEAGFSPDLPPFSAIGYRQIIDYLQGEISFSEAINRMKRISRRYVRRQANWFKKDDPNIRWYHVQEDIVDDLETLISRFVSE